MFTTRFVLLIFWVVVMVLNAGAAYGQTYPNKPIRIVTGGAGGGNDFTARQIAEGISGPLAQPVIVDNRLAVTSIEAVAKAPPDGYTLLVTGSPLWLTPLLRANTSWDPVRDFSPITLVEQSPNALVVHPSLPVKSVKELIALAKARPGELNYASSVIGGSGHLAAELFKAMAGVNIAHIPYKSGGAALNGLVGGEVQLYWASASTLAPHLKSGRLRAVAVTSAQPSALFPGLPTVAATVPGYEATSMTVLLAPAKTPAAIIERLNREVVRVLSATDMKEKFFNTGAQATSSSPEELAAIIKSDMASMGKVIKDMGIKVD